MLALSMAYFYSRTCRLKDTVVFGYSNSSEYWVSPFSMPHDALLKAGAELPHPGFR